jgi:hypothetical protein
VIYDLRNGGDPTRPHGVVEVQLLKGHAVTKGLKTSLYELRAMRRQAWRKLYPVPTFFIVSRETGKLSYHWRHAFAVAESGPDSGSVINPDSVARWHQERHLCQPLLCHRDRVLWRMRRPGRQVQVPLAFQIGPRSAG